MFSSFLVVPIKGGQTSGEKAHQDEKQAKTQKVVEGNLPKKGPPERLNVNYVDEQPTHRQTGESSAHQRRQGNPSPLQTGGENELTVGKAQMTQSRPSAG